MSSDSTIGDIVSAHFQPLIAQQDSAEKGKAVGILVGVTSGGVPYYFSFGDVPMYKGGATPPPQDIVMFIGSNTKVFTATLLALGSFQSPPIPTTGDTLVQDLLPGGTGIRLFNGMPISLWHLATHSAAFPDGPCGKYVFGNYPFTETASFLADFAPPYQPGVYWNYSDQGFALLGVLLSHAYSWTSGNSTTWDTTYQNWPAIVVKNVINPLGMTTTQVDYCSVIANVAQPFAYEADQKPYNKADPPKLVMDSAALGAGSLSSTLTDMVAFLQAQITPPSGNLGQAIAQTQLVHGTGLSMGLGWQIANGYFDKNGILTGYGSYMAFDPKAKIGLVVMANCAGGDGANALCTAGRQTLGALRNEIARVSVFPVPAKDKIPQCPV